MSDAAAGRWGSIAGLAALTVGGAATVFERGSPPAGASAVEVAAFFTTNATVLRTQSLLFLISSAFMLWFLATLRAHLSAASDRSARHGALVFGAGVAYVVLSIVAQGGQVAVAVVAARTPAPELVVAMAATGSALFTVAAVPAAVMLVAFAVSAGTGRAVPGWLGLIAAVAAATQLGLLAGVVVDTGPMAASGWYAFVPYPCYVGWLVATAIVLYRRSGRSAAPSGPPPDQQDLDLAGSMAQGGPERVGERHDPKPGRPGEQLEHRES
ncbi:hypothetical protein [Pseudonocardia sp. GCM10023141]|uniref:hypothetical protein n=1 Tax=Pseudonocardia sp. GCM10023141 TaxID=3252653 RepID=UPI0036078045